MVPEIASCLKMQNAKKRDSTYIFFSKNAFTSLETFWIVHCCALILPPQIEVNFWSEKFYAKITWSTLPAMDCCIEFEKMWKFLLRVVHCCLTMPPQELTFGPRNYERTLKVTQSRASPIFRRIGFLFVLPFRVLIKQFRSNQH